MKRSAFGLITPEGREPALCASTPAPPWTRANASAIWLRLEFSTQTNNTRFIGAPWVVRIGSVRASGAAQAGRTLARHVRRPDAAVVGEEGEQRAHVRVVGEQADDASFAPFATQAAAAHHVQMRAQGSGRNRQRSAHFAYL